MEDQQKEEKEEEVVTSAKESISHLSDVENQDLSEQLQMIWTKFNSEDALRETTHVLSRQIEDLLQSGLEAFQKWEQSDRELRMLHEDIKAKDQELDRLRAAEEKNRKTITNLLTARAASQIEIHEVSQAAIVEATLRTELGHVIGQRDEAMATAAGSKRKLSLVQEDLRQTKAKVFRLAQEKAQMEREQLATTLTLAKTLDRSATETSNSYDVTFYKRKVEDLTRKVQSLNVRLVEKNRQLDDLRRQLERNMSQERLANLRKQQDTSKRMP